MKAAIETPPGYRFFHAFPPAALLPAAVAKLATEYVKLEEVATKAQAAATELEDARLDTDAEAADDAARTAAVRAGKDPAAVGSPAVDALDASRQEARARWLAHDRAVKDVAAEIITHCIEIGATGDPKATGRARIEFALDTYSNAVSDLVAARDAVARAAALPMWIDAASRAYGHPAAYRDQGAAPPLSLPVPDGSGANPGHLVTTTSAVAAWLTADAADADLWMKGGRR